MKKRIKTYDFNDSDNDLKLLLNKYTPAQRVSMEDLKKALDILEDSINEPRSNQSLLLSFIYSYELTAWKTPERLTAFQLATQNNQTQVIKFLTFWQTNNREVLGELPPLYDIFHFDNFPSLNDKWSFINNKSVKKVSERQLETGIKNLQFFVDISKSDPKSYLHLVWAYKLTLWKTEECFTALHVIASSGNTELLKFLVFWNININIRDNQGITPLHDIVERGDLSIINLFINKGANINAQTNTGLTPFHYAIYYDQKDAAALLISKGANINAKTDRGESPLHYAVYLNNITLTNLLLCKGAIIDSQTIEGRTPLHFAVILKHTELAKILINQKADIHVTDKDGKTPLDLARDQNLWEIANFLMMAEAHAFLRNNVNQKTPFEYLREKNYIETVSLSKSNSEINNNYNFENFSPPQEEKNLIKECFAIEHVASPITPYVQNINKFKKQRI